MSVPPAHPALIGGRFFGFPCSQGLLKGFDAGFELLDALAQSGKLFRFSRRGRLERAGERLGQRGGLHWLVGRDGRRRVRPVGTLRRSPIGAPTCAAEQLVEHATDRPTRLPRLWAGDQLALSLAVVGKTDAARRVRELIDARSEAEND